MQQFTQCVPAPAPPRLNASILRSTLIDTLGAARNLGRLNQIARVLGHICKARYSRVVVIIVQLSRRRKKRALPTPPSPARLCVMGPMNLVGPPLTE